MGEFKKQLDYVMDGFFSFFGFIENPAEKEVKAIMQESSSEKLKKDLQKVNRDFRNKYKELRKEALCLE